MAHQTQHLRANVEQMAKGEKVYHKKNKVEIYGNKTKKKN